MANFSEVDWNDIDDSSGSGMFMRLEEGMSVVRVLGNPVQFNVHWLDTPSGKMKVNAPENRETAKRLVDAGFKSQKRWFVKVLDRSDDKFKLLEVGIQILKNIRTLSKNPKWGKLSGYDITITRGKKGSNPLYSVAPDPHEPLDEGFRASFVSFNDGLDFEKLLTPSTDNEIYDAMGWKVDGAASSDPFSGGGDMPFNFDD